MMKVSKSWLEASLDAYKPWLWFTPNFAHQWMNLSLKSLCFMDESLEKENQNWMHWQEHSWKNLKFRNPIGIAGGVDKSAETMSEWWRMGVGFVEVGTVTPAYQSANPGKIIARDVSNESLWNKMGFPNPGCKNFKFTLEKYYSSRATPVFINIGKNRWTENDKAHEDYTYLIDQLHPFTDAFVLNISSPNTTGLRDLFKKENLKPLLEIVLQHSKLYAKPLLLKLSPDEDPTSLENIIQTSIDVGVDGYIVSNTTLSRPKDSPFPKDGGLSGKPLSTLSKETLVKLVQKIGTAKSDKLIINAGGIFNYQDVQERLNLGANLVQIYSGIVFNGPYIFKKIARDHFLK